MSGTNSERVLPRHRQPFIGLAFAALVGILADHVFPVPTAPALAAAALCAVLALSARFRFAIWPAVVFTFVALHGITSTHSPAAQLARQLTESWQLGRGEFRILSDPVGDDRSSRFEAELIALDCPDATLIAPCRVLVRWRGPRPQYGDVWALDTSLRNVPGPRNPGQFNYRRWLETRGIRSELRVAPSPTAAPLRSEPNPLIAFAIHSRRWIEHTLSLDIAGTQAAAIIRAMTVGDTSDIPPATEEGFRRIGVFHLFSVSGLHVGMIALLLWGALGFTGLGGKRAVFILIPAVFFYALITGWKPPSIRAATMIAIVAAGLLFDRKPLALNSVAAAAILILALNPLELFNPGFQLSFVVVIAILLLASPIRRRIEPLLQPDPFIPRKLLHPIHRRVADSAREIGALTAVSLAAWIGSLPLSIWYFHLVPLAAIPANVVAVPLSFVLLALSLIALATGLVSPWIAGVFNNTNLLVTNFLVALVLHIASWPGSHFYVGPPWTGDAHARITVLDAGGGAAVVLQTPDRSWLIDAGSAYDAESVVVPFLRSRGVTTLDAAVLTHGDTRHVGGFPEIFENLPVHRVLDSPLRDRSPSRAQALAAAYARSIPVETVATGDSFSLARSVHVEILHPPPTVDNVYADDKTLVFRVTVGDFRVLLLSDAGPATEHWLTENVPDQLACDLLIKGHHFSGTPGGTILLRLARPQSAIISAADFPPSERPPATWLATATELGIRVYRQDLTGAVTVEIRDNDATLTPFLPPPEPTTQSF